MISTLYNEDILVFLRSEFQTPAKLFQWWVMMWWVNVLMFYQQIQQDKNYSLIARFTGPTWGPCWPRELCYLGSFTCWTVKKWNPYNIFLWFLHTELVKFVEILPHRKQDINLSNIFQDSGFESIWSIPWLHPHLWAYEVKVLCQLYHLPLDKLATISQTTFWVAFSWMKSFVFWLKNTLKFFPEGTLLAITQHWFR